VFYFIKRKGEKMVVKRFKVGFSYTEAGFVEVLAANEREADHIVKKSLEDDGLDEIMKNAYYDTVHRTYEIDAVEEV
jgi:hypothetical protein